MSGGVKVSPFDLDDEEVETLIQGKRFRITQVTQRVFIFRSITDTSAAARHRKTHYDRMD